MSRAESGNTPKPKVLVAVCTYNEINNLPDLVKAIFSAVADVDLLVVDDGSPDGTGEWVETQTKIDPRISLIQRGAKLGLGSAIVAAMRHAIAGQYDFLVNLDGDFSHDPIEIPVMLTMAKESGADVVIGSRYVEGGAIEGWPITRKLMSTMLNRFAQFGLGLQPRDCSGAFRCYRVSVLESMDLSRIRATGYAMLEEILWLMTREDTLMVEVPITFNNRTRGESKLSFRESVRSLAVLMQIGFLRRK